VGHAAQEQLSRMGIYTIGDLARCDQRILQAKLGKMGLQLSLYARGEDDSPVAEAGAHTEAKSVGNGSTFPRDLLGREEIAPQVLALCDQVAARLRKHGYQAATVTVAIKDPMFHLISRQRTLSRQTDLAREIYQTAMEIMDQSWDYRQPVRAVTITASGFDHGDMGEQLSLFGPVEEGLDQQKLRRLETAMDGVRQKYGRDALAFARTVKREPSVPKEDEAENNRKK